MVITDKRKGYYLSRVVTDKKIQPVVCIADCHMGHKNFNKAKLIEVIQWIQDHDAIWFGGGDLIECSNRSSVGAGWAEQLIDPGMQMEEMVEYLKPIKDNCVGLVGGNHEERAYKDTGINPTQIMANMLQVPSAGDELFLIVANDREQDGRGKAYSIYGAHTKTTNKNSGLAFNGMSNNIGSWMNCDVICKAHGHDMGLSPPSVRVSIDKKNMAVTENEMYYWLVGHYLDRPDSYISKRSAAPKPIGTTAIYLDMDINAKKRVTHERI